LNFVCRAKHPQVDQGRSDHQEAGGGALAGARAQEHGGAAQGPTLRHRQAEGNGERSHAHQNPLDQQDARAQAPPQKVQRGQEN